MARRTISTRGRVLAAGVCVGVTGLLAGLMAATDDTGNASANPASTGSSVQGTQGKQGSPYDGSYDADGDGRVGDPGDFSGTHGQVPDGFGEGDRFGSDSSGGQSGTSGSSRQPTFPQPDTRSGGS